MNITAGAVLLIFILVIIGLALLITKTGKRIRLRASGTADEIITKDASTPEGAKAYYNTAIAKREEDYQKAHIVYSQTLGKIQTYEEQLRGYQKENAKLNIDIDTCVKKNDDEAAKVYLKRQQEITDKVIIVKDALEKLKESAKIQKENIDDMYEALGELKAEKENVILKLETVQATKSLQTTSGINHTEEEKMLEKVRDGVRKTTEEADGNKIAYESSTEVQQKRLDKKMKDEDIERRLQELKAKREK